MLVQVLGTVLASGTEAESMGSLPFLVGGGIMAFFLIALFVCVSFSNVGLRHQAHAEAPDTHKQFTNKHGSGDH